MEELDRFLQFSAKTEGRDKIYRTAQYGARFVSGVLGSMGSKSESVKDAVTRLTKLSSVMSDGRKLFRLYKSLHEVPKFPTIWQTKESTLMKSLQSAKVSLPSTGLGALGSEVACAWLGGTCS